MKRIIGLAMLAALTGCSGKRANSDASGNTAATDDTQSGTTAQASNQGFRDKFVAQCVAQAKTTTPIKADFTPICQCSADKLLAGKSPADMAKGVAPDEARAVAAQCAKEHPLKPA